MLRLKLIQQAYITSVGDGDYDAIYVASAVNMDDKDDDGYSVVWDPYLRWLRSNDDDEGCACNWKKYRVYDSHGHYIPRRNCRVYNEDGNPMWK